MKTTENRTACIIGAGPSGLMAAEVLAENGFVVTVYDAMPSSGRKLLLAGAHGGLNLTHDGELQTFLAHYGVSASKLSDSLHGFTPDDLRSWCERLGHPTFVGTSGCVFPKEMHAKGLLRSWLVRLKGQGVRFVFRHKWQGWSEDGSLVFIKQDGQEIVI
jgi:predicted flavoprotein YhiN